MMEQLETDKEKDKKKKSKGKDTLFRVAYRNQISLIQIADNKANMIISINTMIISSIIAVSGYGVLTEKIAYDKTKIIVPLTLIVLSCLASTILAIQAARPKIIRNSVKIGEKGKSSLLFFGVISQFSQEQYLSQMNTLLADDKEVYDTMTIDLYNQGLVLKRKYALLAHAYRIFMFGFVISVIIFLAFLMLG